jgi:hypothetical protein
MLLPRAVHNLVLLLLLCQSLGCVLASAASQIRLLPCCRLLLTYAAAASAAAAAAAAAASPPAVARG